VGGNVTTFVIRVDGEVKTHQFDKVLVVFVTQELGEVVRVILIGIDGRELTILVEVTVDTGGNLRELGDQVHGILKSRIPVLGLVDTLRVSLGKVRIVLQSVDSNGELRHRVERLGTTVNDFLNEFRNVRTSSPFGRESLDLFLGGDFTSDKQPEERLGERLTTFLGSGEDLLALGDGLSTETDTFLSIEDGTFPDETLDTTHTTVSLVNGDFTKDMRTIVLFEFLDFGLLFGNEFGKTFLQSLWIWVSLCIANWKWLIVYLNLGRISTGSTDGGGGCETESGLTSGSLG
jgi:hypothetical protein